MALAGRSAIARLLRATACRRVQSEASAALRCSDAALKHHSSRKNSMAMLAGAAATLAGVSTITVLQKSSECESAPSTATSPQSQPSSMKSAKALPWSKLTLYQYATCPFCNKVRAFLDFYGVPYSVVEVNPLTKKEIKDWSGDYKKVPIVTLDNGSERLVESSDIIDTLYTRLAEANQKTVGKEKASKERKRNASALEEEREWRKWVDERWVHVVTPNLYRTAKEAKQSFDYMTRHGNFSTSERETARWFGAAFMYGMSKYKLKPKHNISDERQAMYEEADKFVNALGTRDFLGGKEPNLADLSVFGVVRAIQGTDTFTDLMSETGMQPWFVRMQQAVGPSAEQCSNCSGSQ